MRSTNNGNWKKSIRDTGYLVDKTLNFGDDIVIVSCVKKIRASSLTRGDYGHLDMYLTKDGPSYPRSILPSESNGKYSRINVQGKEVIHKDLPMVTKTFWWEAPNYGDPSNGYHDVYMDREVYQRSYIGPKHLEIKIELMAQEAGANEPIFVFKFTVDELLDRTDEHFPEDIHFNANLLQENVGAVDVFPANASREDYLRTIYVGWEILPPGTREETIARIVSTARNSNSPELQRRIAQRYAVFARLKPQAFIRGASGFQRYFGAKFADDFVVFENLDYGNALYVMFGNWENLSRMSRTELLRGDREGFERIVHMPGWEDKLERLLQQHRHLVHA